MKPVVIMPVLAHVAMTNRAVASVQRLLAPGGGHPTLIAMDNGSSDGCGPLLRSLTNTLVFTYPRTRSLNRIWNDALTLCFDRLRQPYVLVANNDVVLHRDTYVALVADGGLFVTAVGRDRAVDDEPLPSPLPRRPHPDFSCFLIRRECWERVGRFDESYWAFASDCAYHLRMHAMGIEAVSLPVPFFHESSGTLKYASNAMRDFICKKADEDRATFLRQHGFTVGSPEYYAKFAEAGS